MKSLTATFLCMVLLGSAIAAWADTNCGIPSYPVLTEGSGLCEPDSSGINYACQPDTYTTGGCDDNPSINNACGATTTQVVTYTMMFGNCGGALEVGTACAEAFPVDDTVSSATTAGIQCVQGG
jgi:hypothetical protein